MGMLRGIIALFVVLAGVYFLLSRRQIRRERLRLEEEFDEGGRQGDRDSFIDEGLEAFEHSLRHKLILGVFLVPLLVVALLIYVTNFA